MIRFDSKERNFAINVPTSIDEITPEYLTKVLQPFALPKNYAIVGAICGMKVFDFIAMIDNKDKDTNMSVELVLGKANPSDDVYFTGNVGDSLIINKTDLERGIQLDFGASVSPNFIASYIKNDAAYSKAIMVGDELAEDGERLNQKRIYVVQFKIVPIIDIKCIYNRKGNVKDDFLIKK